jgi:hypothetical protein
VKKITKRKLMITSIVFSLLVVFVGSNLVFGNSVIFCRGDVISCQLERTQVERGDLLDQQQLNITAWHQIGAWPYGAQSFIPTLKIVTRIELHVVKNMNLIDGNVTVSIRKILQGNDLTSVSVPFSQLPEYGWFVFDFPDIDVIPSESYYMVVHYNITNALYWGFSDQNDYPRGEAWLYRDQNWYQESYVVDFCFKTYGSGNTPPSIPYIDGPLN